MRLKLPRHVQGFVDRHGKPRYYLRRPGFRRVPLPGVPYSPEFMSVYEAAMNGEPLRAAVEMKAGPGTIHALAVAYFNNSANFHALSPSTQRTYRNWIESFAEAHGEKRVALLQPQHIQNMMAAKAKTPTAANNLLRTLRLLMDYAVQNRWRRDDPSEGIKPLKTRAGGFYTWTEDDIAAYEEKHAVGTRARLALDLLLYTAQRRSDVVRMGPQHIKHERLRIRQQKTGAVVDMKVLPELRTSLDALSSGHLTFLVTAQGKPFTSAGFGNWFREMCDEAGLPKACAAHGLRKAASRRLAESGCTAHEIMAITGHKTLREVTRYTEAFDRSGRADAAVAKLGSRTSIVKPSKAV